VVVLVAALFADHAIGPPAAARLAAASPAVPEVAPEGSLSSTWFCPALQATGQSSARGRIIVGNPTPAVLTGTVTVVPSQGAPVVDHPVIQPYTRLTYRLEDVAPGPYAAATVSLSSAGGAVEQEVQGPLGQSITPCASASSDHWYFAAGRTDENATELLSLYNPYPAPAIADLTFATDTGPTTPDAFQGIVVPGQGFNVIDIGARVRIRALVGATVDVTSGRLVADNLLIDSATPGQGPSGLALTLGATDLGDTWYYPDGGTGSGLSETFHIYNPGANEADVQLTPVLEEGSADPFDLTVPPDAVTTLEVDQQQRIPPGVGEAWVLTSTNGAPVVAERLSVSAPPAVHTGISDTIGTPVLATRWLFPAGSAATGADEWLVTFNPGSRPAHIQVVASGSGQPQDLPAFTVAPGSRRAIQLSTVYPKGIVMLDVRSDVPVAAERAQFVVGGPGMSGSIGIVGGQ
jgi:hypothetical protein